jgi:tripartite-type tricarboxylate transporter receptor subunit TctC
MEYWCGLRPNEQRKIGAKLLGPLFLYAGNAPVPRMQPRRAMTKRIALSVLIAGAAALALSGNAKAFPERTSTIIVPYQAGGSTDILARLVAQRLAERWKRNVVVENRTGGNGAVAINAVKKSDPDGYTWLAVASSRLTLGGSVSRAFVDFANDFAPISRLGYVANMVVVHPSVPAHSISELIAVAKSKPGMLTYGTQSIGSNGHLNGELFQQRSGVKLLHVPYKGSAAAVSDLISGQINIMFDNLPTVLAPIKSGQLRALAVTTKTRSTFFPDVPTVDEAGLPGFDTSAWFALVVPKDTPEAIRIKIEKSVVEVVSAPDIREKMKQFGVIPAAEGASDLMKRTEEEKSMWEDVLAKANIKLD